MMSTPHWEISWFFPLPHHFIIQESKWEMDTENFHCNKTIERFQDYFSIPWASSMNDKVNNNYIILNCAFNSLDQCIMHARNPFIFEDLNWSTITNHPSGVILHHLSRFQEASPCIARLESHIRLGNTWTREVLAFKNTGHKRVRIRH